MPEISSARPQIIFDNIVLSNFALIEQLAILEKLYSRRACTSLSVVDEIRRGIVAGYAGLQSLEYILRPLSPTGWLKVLDFETSREQTLFIELTSTFGAGEAACLALAVERTLVFASDDLAARRAARRMGVSLSGTLGILVRGVRENHLTLETANRILTDMVAQGYRSLVEQLDDLISL